MKKRVITILLVSSILLTGCKKEDVSPESETQEPLIYVERDDLLYGKDDTTSSEEDVLTPTSEESEPSVSTPSTTSVTSDIPDGNGTVDLKPNTDETPSSENPQYRLPDGIYETTVVDIIDVEATFGDIIIDYLPYVLEDTEGIGYGGVTYDVRLGENNYGAWRYVLFGDNDFLPVSGAENHKSILIDNSGSNGISFAFNGAGHNFKGNEDNSPTIFLEIEEAKGVASAKRAASISTPEAFKSAVKGVSSTLGEFNSVDATGYAVYHPTTDIVYEIVLGDTVYQLRVGCPYQKLVDLLGEGSLISDEEHNYYAYKTDEFTLVVEKTEYPDVKPSNDLIELGVSENTILISSIFLIQNQVTLPESSEEG